MGIWGALSNVYPDALEQRCWNHKMVNVLDKLPKKAHAQAKKGLQNIVYSESLKDAEDNRNIFIGWCGKRGYHRAIETLERDWDRMVTFYQFPKEHWKHLRTTNIVESPFAALRLRTDAAKRYKKVANATSVIWKMLMVAEQRFRKLDAPEKMEQVYLGVQFRDGVEVNCEREEVLAAVC
jgi:transposase-like protein